MCYNCKKYVSKIKRLLFFAKQIEFFPFCLVATKSDILFVYDGIPLGIRKKIRCEGGG